MNLIPRHSLFDMHDILVTSIFPAPKAKAQGIWIFCPRVDINDKSEHYEISADLPGVYKKKIFTLRLMGICSQSKQLQPKIMRKKDWACDQKRMSLW
ncbi:hypothetical protein H5181_00650 [Shewanella sp. SG44-2]|uniref:hypothetical protein n=1 Tax=Shewanella sp. SG44-2 TaxID=2760962 RepID=UPI0015FEC789|nr:hypothetical protein [Shewanella sp. SG44-2]MBB1381643.1 hypothetical protein [Shewanella sp. SR41-2]MBB1424966.1 hypothetical protein [Shewanella sp. SG44-2]